MTGLDGLAGSRNAVSERSTMAPISAAKGGSGSEPRPHADDASAFDGILSDLSRPDDPGSGSSSSAQAGEAAKSPTISARGLPDLGAGGPRAASGPEASLAVFVDRVAGTVARSPSGEPGSSTGAPAAPWPGAEVGPEAPVSIFVDRVAGTSGRTPGREPASAAGAHAAALLEVPESEAGSLGSASGPRTADGPEPSVAVLVDRAVGTSRRSDDGILPSRAGELGQALRGAREDEPRLQSDAGARRDVAFGTREAPRRRLGIHGSADPVGDLAGSLPERGAGPDPSAAAGVSAAASIVGLPYSMSAQERSGDARAGTEPSRDTSTSEPAPRLGTPIPGEAASGPRGPDRPDRSIPEETESDREVSWPATAIGPARERARGVATPGFLEPVAHIGEERLSLRAPARETVIVLAAETHFPPAALPSPIDQIFRSVAADLDTALAPDDPGHMPEAATAAGEARDASATCLRTLTVLLEPANLGTVTIKLRLSGTNLGLEIEADEAETTRLIGRSRPALAEKLRALGMSIDDIEVCDVARPRRFP